MSKADTRAVIEGWNVRPFECWSDWMPWNVGKRNWRSFTLAYVDVEIAPGLFELTFILLGVGFTADWRSKERTDSIMALAEDLGIE